MIADTWDPRIEGLPVTYREWVRIEDAFHVALMQDLFFKRFASMEPAALRFAHCLKLSGRPVPRSEKEVQAALMGMDVRPLVCPRCEGELLPTDESPDVFSCPECERLVNWLDALQASDRVYAQRKDKADG